MIPASGPAIDDGIEHLQRLATLGTIASLIAHEFNNILTPVMSYAQMALAAPHDVELTRKALLRAAEGTERASQIATAILDFAKQDLAAESGPHAGMVWRGDGAATCDVRTAIDLAMDCLARDPGKDRIKFHVEAPSGDCLARIRPVALQQVLLNLILNARRALGSTEAGGQSLCVRISRVASLAVPPRAAATSVDATEGHGGPFVLVAIEDEGCGITTEQLAKAFTPFVSGAEPAREETVRSGSGLGLVVCARLITQAGGRVWIESCPGKGTTVTVALRAA